MFYDQSAVRVHSPFKIPRLAHYAYSTTYENGTYFISRRIRRSLLSLSDDRRLALQQHQLNLEVTVTFTKLTFNY